MRPRVGFGPAPAESAVSAVVAPLDDGFTGWHATSVKELEADKEPKQARSATEGDACLSHLHVFTGHTDLGGALECGDSDSLCGASFGTLLVCW